MKSTNSTRSVASADLAEGVSQQTRSLEGKVFDRYTTTRKGEFILLGTHATIESAKAAADALSAVPLVWTPHSMGWWSATSVEGARHTLKMVDARTKLFQ